MQIHLDVVLEALGSFFFFVLYNKNLAHSTNIDAIQVLETVILMLLPVLIWRLKEVNIPNFAVDLFFIL